MVPAAGGNRELLPLSIVGWFSPLPWLGYASGSVVPDVCPLVLVAARGLSAAMHGDAQNGSRPATVPGGQGVVGSAGPWPRYDAPVLLPHGGPSDLPVQ